MIIRVLIINRQLVFAVTIKQALEQTGAFEVHPFTDPDAAVEYLRTHPHDVALVDFSITVVPGPEIVRNLRQIQPEIAIIVSPSQSAQVVRDLDIQQTIDPPFSARSIIPVIEQAVQQTSQPLSALTKTFVDSESPESYPTEILADEPPSDESPRAFASPSDEQPAQTFILSEHDDKNLTSNVEHTRIFSEDEVAEGEAKSTRIPDEDDNLPGTRIFDDHEAADSSGDDGEVEDDITRMLNTPPESMVTHIFDEDDSAPPDLPEFSTLDDILNSEAPSTLYEPPAADEDTPSVPEVDSDAVRQYLATESRKGDGIFDEMLGEISPEDEGESPQLPASTGFDELVKSMSGDQPHTPLPDRHQQFVEFILTGGMDGLLSEIEKSQTEPLDSDDMPDSLPEEPEASNFEKLAQEEPPLPSLEESGTVGDLMIGVSDTSFRNVLNMMRGEDPVDETGGQDPPNGEDDYAALFDSHVVAEDDEIGEETPPPVRRTPAPIPEPEYDEGDSIPAQLILETAMDESTPPEAFSINSLLGTIEQQLSEHKPDIQPLPSWKIDSIQRPSRSKRRKKGRTSNRYIDEPDFLPEEFTSDYIPTVEEASADEEPAEEEIFDHAESVEEIYDQMIRERSQPPTEADETLSLFEELGESVASETAPQQPEEPEDLIPSLEDTSPTQTVSDDSLPELPADDSHFLETVLGEAAYAQEDIDEYDKDEEAAPAEEMDWDPAAMLQQSNWDAEQAPPVEAEVEDDWTMPEELDLEEQDEFEEAHEEANDFEAAFDGVLGETEPDEALAEVETPVDSGYAAELSEADEDDWAISVEEGSEPEPEYIEEVAPTPLEQQFDVVDRDDPYIAQIALSLTQVSLELAAEATILTNEEEIVAIAGELDPNDVEEIRDLIADDWDADDGDQARVRFITLASSGKDYMLYSRRTVGDFTLSMVFAGSTPLRDIRRQGRRLLDALEAVPDEVAEHEAPELATILEHVPAAAVTPVEEQSYQPFTYLWLLRDTDYSLEDHTQRAIAAGLSMQLSELGWQIKTLQAQGEYVYIRADVPGERPAHEIIGDLKQRSAEIARVQEPDLEAPDLWADSYLVMMPGRELDPEEIDQFIDFERLY